MQQQLFNVVKTDLWTDSWDCCHWWPKERRHEGASSLGRCESKQVSYVQEQKRWYLPGHHGLKSNTNCPRNLEKILFPEVTWRMRLYRPMTALAGLEIVKFVEPASLGPWTALQPLAPASERLNTAFVRWDSEGDGPAGKKGWLVSIPECGLNVNLTLEMSSLLGGKH